MKLNQTYRELRRYHSVYGVLLIGIGYQIREIWVFLTIPIRWIQEKLKEIKP